MKERLVKGRHVRGILELLEVRGRLETLPELAPPGADLVRKTVYPTTWYQLHAFDALLESVHRYVFDGSEAAGQAIGRLLAQRFLVAHEPPLEDSPLTAGEVLATYWEAHFNFGQVLYERHDVDGDRGVRIRITGFPDMSSCQGHVWMGWSAEVLEQACKGKAALKVEERPWMHNSVLTYTLTSHTD